MNRRAHPVIEWPDRRRFAVAIFDDTDLLTLEVGRVVYRHLTDLGIRATKSVWIHGPADSPLGGDTCDDESYLAWIRELIAEGHEVGYHNASDHTSTRAETIAALDRFAELFGSPPRCGADHAGNREALYWGAKRLTGARRRLYRAGQRVVRPDRPTFDGEDPRSERFWGDVCRDRITYWRNFTFSSVDLLAVTPRLPYHDPRRSYVNYWFSSTDASSCTSFVRRLSAPNLDHLEATGGVTILYTHFGNGFCRGGVLDPDFVRTTTDLASRQAWIAPVSEVLDHLRSQLSSTVLTDRERAALEWRWIVDRLVGGGLKRLLQPPPTERSAT